MIRKNLIRKHIHELRKNRGLTTSEMAEALGIESRNYIALENGTRKKIDIEELDIISRTLNANLLDIIREGYEDAAVERADVLEKLLSVIDEYSVEKDRYVSLQAVLIGHLIQKRDIANF